MPTPMTEKPFLILTLRRTGGTSLMTFLTRVSAFPLVEHEPFNPGRCWHDLARDFAATRDAGALAAGLAGQMAARPNIKHCVELVSPAVTRALVEAAAARDYGIFVLTRADEAARQFSLAVAVATGAWGPREAAKAYPEIQAGALVPKPLDATGLARRARLDAAALGQTLALLRNRRIAHDWLVFEELYKGETPVQHQARRLAASLGITVGPDDPRLAAFARREGQGTAAIEPWLAGVAEFRAALAAEFVS